MQTHNSALNVPETATKTLSRSNIETPLGSMVAMADEKALYLLEFTDRTGLSLEIDRLKKRENALITEGNTEITIQIQQELGSYFNGGSFVFETPIRLSGSAFQKKVWHNLMQIPAGQTGSYKDLAIAIDQPKGVRAVANAVGRNQLAIIIPCHRIIGHNGNLTGYAGGLKRKDWLLKHEAL